MGRSFTTSGVATAPLLVVSSNAPLKPVFLSFSLKPVINFEVSGLTYPARGGGAETLEFRSRAGSI
jgi:hypothetical protein